MDFFIGSLVMVFTIFLFACNGRVVTNDDQQTNVIGNIDSDTATVATDHSIEIDSSEIVKIVTIIGDRLSNSRYMEGDCNEITYPGWEGFPTKKCTYTIRDNNGTVKSAEVVMLNPSAEKLATWIYTTCIEVKGRVDDADVKKLINQVINQSGGQFPVAGIVYEDLLPKPDGIKEIYCFRNGVTVRIDGVPHMGTVQPTNEEIDSSINGTVIQVMKYARIQSTTPNQYLTNGGTENVGTDDNRTLIWLEVVKESYQRAWKTDENDLMVAWARQNL